MNTMGRYRILEPLGTCEMGTLARAYDRSLDRVVALRIIPDEMGLSASLKARFFQEAREWARLRHPNLAAVYDLGEDEGQLFVAMELLEGEELAVLLADRRPVFLEDKLSLAIQICDGLYHAHQHGVVHRDVKPANVIVLRSGQVKIVSFGLAPLLAGDDELSPQPRLILGSFRHLAPEQARGQADHRSDVFAVGALLYELLTFRPAFEGDDPLDVLEQVRAATPPSVREIDPTVPGDLAGIVERALAKDPADRFPDLAEMRAALEFVRRRFVDDPERLAAYARGQLNQLRELQAVLAERVAQEGGEPALHIERQAPTPTRRFWRIPRPTWPIPALAAGLVAVTGLGVLGLLTVTRPISAYRPIPYAALPGLRPGPRLVDPVGIALVSPRPAPRPGIVSRPRPEPNGAAGRPAGPSRELAEMREVVQTARAAAEAAREAHAELVRATAELRMAIIASTPAIPAGEAPGPDVVAAVPPGLAAPTVPPAPDRPTPPPGTGSSWLAALREMVPNESARQGTAGPVEWEIQDVRHELAEDGRYHWSYVLVVHDRSGAGIRFEREERSVQTDGLEPTITSRPLSPSDATLEIAVRDQARVRREAGFPSRLVRGDLRVWHRLHGRDEFGRPIRVDVRFRLDAPTQRI
ncbi:MAG TPA: serine/threonine-protein kinase [Methylomirabilota bacterium]|nr:serine/threonine-protein kinase [Methylomirabilota bacterium]